jgi:integrase
MASSKERVVRRTLADGSVKEYRYVKGKPDVEPAAKAGSIGALVEAYKRSPEWTALRAATHKNYGYYLADLIADLADVPVISVRRRTLLSMRDAIASARGNGAANVFMRVTATLFRWARDREWTDRNPADRVRQLPGGHLLAWTEEEADVAVQHLPKELAQAVILARYTGQRRGDLINMTWRAYDGRSIRVLQEKTRETDERKPMVIRAHPELKKHLDQWKADAVDPFGFILVPQLADQWTRNHLSFTMRIEMRKLKMREGLNIHGLRKLAASALAEAGCSTHEIAAVTGHKSLAMVELYTRSAAQERMADAAIVRLEHHIRKGSV